MGKRKTPTLAPLSVAEQLLETGRRALRDGDLVEAAIVHDKLRAAGAAEETSALHDAIVRARIFKTIATER